MPAPTEHLGGCHCGRVRYRVITDFARVQQCNCSICSMRGLLLTFVPSTQFTLLQGGEQLSDYTFNLHQIHHLFCTRCGVSSFLRGIRHDGAPMVAVNVRCVDGIDLRTLVISPFDGKTLR